LVDEAIPEVEAKVLVDAAEAGDKMLLHGANGTFGGIVAVDSGGHQLELDRFGMEERFEGFRTFVVESVELGSEARIHKASVDELEGAQEAFGHAIAERLHKDVVTVVVVNHHHIIVAVTGRSNKTTSLIAVDLASGLNHSSVDMMCASVQ
jgi:hypothetical protein